MLNRDKSRLLGRATAIDEWRMKFPYTGNSPIRQPISSRSGYSTAAGASVLWSGSCSPPPKSVRSRPESRAAAGGHRSLGPVPRHAFIYRPDIHPTLTHPLRGHQ